MRIKMIYTNKNIKDLEKQREHDGIPHKEDTTSDVISNGIFEKFARYAAIWIIMIACSALVISITIRCYYVKNPIGPEPQEWLITRDMWGARPVENNYTTELFNPIKLAVVQQTVTAECHSFDECMTALQDLQASAIDEQHVDIIYNFLIGNDGRVYEGRGWGMEGAQRFDYNRCSINIGFIGDYRERMPNHTQVTEEQLRRAKMLLREGARLGHLRSDYHVVAARDLADSEITGCNLYNAIQVWDEYYHDTSFNGLTCEEIYATNKL